MRQFLQQIVIQGDPGLRRLKFEPGMNVITGVGSKGKSAVLQIISYCLGASRCDIPAGRVRDFAKWFFLVLNVRNTRVVIGRRAPIALSSTSDDAWFEQGSNPVVPYPARANNTTRGACQLLGYALGLPTGEFQLYGDDKMGRYVEVSGRMEVAELLPLLLQPQDVIATRTLFGTFVDSSSKRRSQVMEIALGILSPRLLQLRAREDALTKRLKAIKKKLERAKAIYHDAVKNLQAIWQQAVFAGLVVPDAIESVTLMRAELERLRSRSIADITAANSAVDAKGFAELDMRSQALRRNLRTAQHELKQIYKIERAAKDADESLHAQASRLRAVDILDTPSETNVSCPLCGSTIENDAEALLSVMQRDLERELAFVASIPPDLNKQKMELIEKIESVQQELRDVEKRINDIEKQAPAPTLTDERVRRERMIGAMEHALVTLPATRSELDAELEQMVADLEEVRRAIQASTKELDASSVERSVSMYMTSLARGLDRMNIGEGRLRFDRSLLTVEREEGVTRIPLPILGGAEIHVMYHLCALLGLHWHLKDTNSFVPRLVVFDQPSQAYFPSDGDQKGTDWDAVRSIYEMLFRFVMDTENQIQVLALDHADFSRQDDRFRAAVRANWHGDDGLIRDTPDQDPDD